MSKSYLSKRSKSPLPPLFRYGEWGQPTQALVKICDMFFFLFCLRLQETFTAHGITIVSEMATAMEEEYHKYHSEMVNVFISFVVPCPPSGRER